MFYAEGWLTLQTLLVAVCGSFRIWLGRGQLLLELSHPGVDGKEGRMWFHWQCFGKALLPKHSNLRLYWHIFMDRTWLNTPKTSFLKKEFLVLL